MINVAICEDDKEQQKEIEKLIVENKRNTMLEIDKFDSGECLVKRYNEGIRYSIIFLDMRMEKMDGISTAKLIRQYDERSIIIIVTSIMEYAMEGYSVNAFDFILKPIEEKMFKEVFNNALSEVVSKYYSIISRDKTKLIKLGDVIYIESNRKKVEIHCQEYTYTSNENISQIERKLINSGFIRISRYYIVNMIHIREFGANSLRMNTGHELNYGKKYKSIALENYMYYMMGDN